MPLKVCDIGAVLFDFDGTLTAPGAICFSRIRRAIGCPEDKPVLEYIQSLPVSAQSVPRQVLGRFELAAAAKSAPNTDAEAVVRSLKDRGMMLGILSRNSRSAVDRALENFKDVSFRDFDFIGTRDLPFEPKPSPAGIRFASEKLGVTENRMIMVGDYVFDIEAGRAAGAVTVFLTNGNGGEPVNIKSDYTIERLGGLLGILGAWRFS